MNKLRYSKYSEKTIILVYLKLKTHGFLRVLIM